MKKGSSEGELEKKGSGRVYTVLGVSQISKNSDFLTVGASIGPLLENLVKDKLLENLVKDKLHQNFVKGTLYKSKMDKTLV